MIQVLFLFLAVLLVLILIAGFLIIPIWLLIHCASSTLSVATKVIWITVMILFWPFGGLAYGISTSKNQRIQWISSTYLLLTTILIGVLFYSAPYLFEYKREEMKEFVNSFPEITIEEATEEIRSSLTDALNTLIQETEGTWYEDLEKKQKAITLYDLFTLMAADTHLSVKEYKDWLSKYEVRNLLSKESIQDELTVSTPTTSDKGFNAPGPSGPERPVPF